MQITVVLLTLECSTHAANEGQGLALTLRCETGLLPKKITTLKCLMGTQTLNNAMNVVRREYRGGYQSPAPGGPPAEEALEIVKTWLLAT